MYSNYNVLTLPISADGKYKVGDIYKAPIYSTMRIRKFDGLKIKNIDYQWGVRLHFDFNEWRDNIIKFEDKPKNNITFKYFF